VGKGFAQSVLRDNRAGKNAAGLSKEASNLTNDVKEPRSAQKEADERQGAVIVMFEKF
jgi:hypothetical protein